MVTARCYKCVLGVASCVLLLLGAGSAWPDQGAEAGGDPCQLGITLALLDRPAAAESVFVSMLSRVPRDSRALNNLGNLALLRGDPELALSFYDQALVADTADAGIRLNLATTLTILGDEESASLLAAEGVRRAGGVPAAASLLGLRLGENGAETPKGERGAFLSKEEVLGLLRAAAGKVPTDSLRAGGSRDTSATRSKRQPPAWRSAGARASGAPEVATLVYWKR